MSKKDEYGLKFIKISSNGNIGYCVRKNDIVDKNNLLQFLSYLNLSSTELLLREINYYLTSSSNVNLEVYDSMALEHIDLQISYPNFIIDGQPDTFPLVDVRDLLQEWLVFLQT